MSKNKNKQKAQQASQPLADEEKNINAAELNEAAEAPAGNGDANAGDGQPQTPEEQVAALQQEVAELKNAMLYKVAEFENYRKRTIKEKADLILNGGRKVMEALLPVADDLERVSHTA